MRKNSWTQGGGGTVRNAIVKVRESAGENRCCRGDGVNLTNLITQRVRARTHTGHAT